MPLRRTRGLGLAPLLAALTFALYLPAARNGFVNLDDDIFVHENAQVRRGLTRETVAWALRTAEHANWYPLTRLTHLAAVSAFGMWPGGHHLVSAALHAAAAGLLCAALRLLTGSAVLAFICAGLFAVHPLQVESVAWASETSNVLAGALFALGLLLWARHVRRPAPARYGAALLAAALGLAAKPTLVTLPGVLLLLDFWPLGRLRLPGRSQTGQALPGTGRLLLEKVPFLLLAAAASAMALAAQASAGAVGGLGTLPLATRLGNAALSYWRYLGTLLWPADLAVFYPHPFGSFTLRPAVLAAGLLAAVSVLAALQWRRRPWLAAGWCWYLGILVPMVGVVQVGSQSMADRYAYLPSIGVFLMLVWSLAGGPPPPPGRRATVFVAAAAAVAALAAATVRQTALWRDELALYTHTLRVTAGNWLIENNLALALVRRGRLEEAYAHSLEALRLRPGDPAYRFNHANLLAALRRPAEAERHYREALRLQPDYVEARHNLGVLLAGLGRLDEAVPEYREALRLRPDYGPAHGSLGVALEAQGRREEALAHYRAALRLQPDDPAAHLNLGGALAERGSLDEAVRHFRDAIRLDPGIAAAHYNLANALRDSGRPEEAVGAYREALRLQPGDAEASANLGALLLSLRRPAEAAPLLERARRLRGEP